MTAAAWPFAIMLGFGTLVALVAITRRHRVRRLGHCPRNANTVVVETAESLWTGESVDVISCSEFRPRTDVRCDKRCLRAGLR